MKVAIIDESGKLHTREKTLYRKIALKTLKLMKVPGKSELCISFTDDTQMRELNKSYRNIDRTTDVLSFPQLDAGGEGDAEEVPEITLLGDIVISTETALRHSKKYGVTYHQELIKLIVHGILHLLGHDHKKKKDTQIMREKEKELLSALEEY